MKTIKLSTIKGCDKLIASLQVCLNIHHAIAEKFADCPELARAISKVISQEQERYEAELLLNEFNSGAA